MCVCVCPNGGLSHQSKGTSVRRLKLKGEKWLWSNSQGLGSHPAGSFGVQWTVMEGSNAFRVGNDISGVGGEVGRGASQWTGFQWGAIQG